MYYYAFIIGIIQYSSKRRIFPAIHEFIIKFWLPLNYFLNKNYAAPQLTAHHFKLKFNNQLAHRSGLMKDQVQALLSCVQKKSLLDPREPRECYLCLRCHNEGYLSGRTAASGDSYFPWCCKSSQAVHQAVSWPPFPIIPHAASLPLWKPLLCAGVEEALLRLW